MPETFADLEFAIRGLDISDEYGRQKPGTTRSGNNVRTCEPSTQRMRGGCRAGLSKYIPVRPDATLVGTQNVLQHLAVIADPQTEGLLGNSPRLDGETTQDGDDGVEGGGPIDPTTNPGTGVQPVPTTPTLYVQSRFLPHEADTNLTPTLAFSSNVTAGNLILVALATVNDAGLGGPAFLLMFDSAGNAYSLVESINDDPFSGSNFRLYYCVANASSPLTITLALNFDSVAGITVAEYDMSLASPFDSSSSESDIFPFNPVSTGVVPVSGGGRFVVAFFCTSAFSQTYDVTPSIGFTLRDDGTNTVSYTTWMTDREGLSSSVEPKLTFDRDAGAMSIGASFRTT